MKLKVPEIIGVGEYSVNGEPCCTMGHLAHQIYGKIDTECNGDLYTMGNTLVDLLQIGRDGESIEEMSDDLTNEGRQKLFVKLAKLLGYEVENEELFT